MVLRCIIHLDGPSVFYAAGGIVTGVIVLSTTWSDKVYGISVKLASKVEVDWDAARLFNPYRTSRNEDVAFHSDCQILMNRAEGDQSCLANLVSKKTIMITRGVTHRYPFLLKLPKDLPCSFNGTFGHVSYKLVVFIRKPFREMYIGATKGIQVAPLLDLNDQSVHLQLPVQDKRKYHLPAVSPTPSGHKEHHHHHRHRHHQNHSPNGTNSGTGSGTNSGTSNPGSGTSSDTSVGSIGNIGTTATDAPTGGQAVGNPSPIPAPVPLVSISAPLELPPPAETISMRIRLPRTAFAPDQLIDFDVEVDNKSHLSLGGVRVILYSNTYFQIDQSWKVDGRTLERCHGPEILPLRKELWSHNFTCPHVLPTGLGTGLCQAIDLQYFIHFELRISETVQLSSVFKLVIGTVPFVHRNIVGSIDVNVGSVSVGGGCELGYFLSSEDSNSLSMDFLGIPELEMRRSSAPPAYDFHMSQHKEHRETPPPSYEEALSMSLSLLRAHTKSASCTDFEAEAGGNATAVR